MSGWAGKVAEVGWIWSAKSGVGGDDNVWITVSVISVQYSLTHYS